MAAPRRFELDEALLRPGSYFNPETEMLIVVDDSATVDADVFEDAGDEDDDRDWVLIADEAPVDETKRDALIQQFETRFGSGATGAVPADLDDDDIEEPELEPDEELD